MFRKNNKNPHFLQKLANREISGNFIRQGKANIQNSPASKLFKTIPSRCVYQLNSVIDLPGNHVFMGTTRCGQFLLTYSFITHTARSTLSQRNKYQLHWWLFRPGGRAAKVAEVQLFADYAVTSILTIGIAQWPTVNERLVVYGFCNNAEDYLEEDHRRYYLTITTLPSLDCRDCLTVAASFDEEDMAANWDSCVSLSCLKHGLTIHSLFDVTPPYPKFHLDISLKLNNSVVFNTVNFLHVLSFHLENPKPDNKPPTSHQHTIVADEINHRVGQMMTVKYPKEYAVPYDINKAFKSANPLAKLVMKQTQPLLLPPPVPTQPQRTASVMHSKEKSSRQWCIRIPNLAMKPVSIRTKVWRRSIIDQAEKVYAFEESEDGGCEPKLKWYRRKRLADKMYEFCSDEDDEDMENIRPPDKCGSKLPRYKYLTPPKVGSNDTQHPAKRHALHATDSAAPFAKMIRNIGNSDNSDTRFMIPNVDSCKRFLHNTQWKTDLDSEIRNETNNDAASDCSAKSNSCSVDETCCDIQLRNMDTVNTPPTNVPKLESSDELSSVINQPDMTSTESNSRIDQPCFKIPQQDMDISKSNSKLDPTTCDIHQQNIDEPLSNNNTPTLNEISDCDTETLKTISSPVETSCDLQHRNMDKPLSINNTPTLNEISDCGPETLKTNSSPVETRCDIQQRNMDKPVTIQIPPIDLPFCVTSEKKSEPLLKEPVFLCPAAVSFQKIVKIETDVASLLDTVSKVCDDSVDTVVDSTPVIHDTLKLNCDSQSISSSCDVLSNPSPVDTVSNTVELAHGAKDDVDIVSNHPTENNDVMETEVIDDKNISVLNHPTGNSYIMEIEVIDDKNISVSKSNSQINDSETVCSVSNDFVSNPPLIHTDTCNTSNDTVSCSSSDIFNSSKTSVSESSLTKNDKRLVETVSNISVANIDIVSNSSPMNVDVSPTKSDTVSNSSSTKADIVSNTPLTDTEVVTNSTSMKTDTNYSSQNCDTVLTHPSMNCDTESNPQSTNADTVSKITDTVSDSSAVNCNTESNPQSMNTDTASKITDTVSNPQSMNTDTASKITDTVTDSSTMNCNMESSPQSMNADTVSKITDIVSNSSAMNCDTVSNSSTTKSDTVANDSPTISDTVSTPASMNCDTVSNTSPKKSDSLLSASSKCTPKDNLTSSIFVYSSPSDTVSNLKPQFDTSNINHDVRAIIADWEADSISSMSPQSEFSSSVTTCNSPKVLDLEMLGENCNERHMVIQRFLEIPPRFGITGRKPTCSHQHRCPNITSNDSVVKVFQHSNVTRCVPMRLSTTHFPPIKIRALQPHNRIRRSNFKSDLLLLSPPLASCVRLDKEEDLKRKKVVCCGGGGVNKNDGERRGCFKGDLLLSPPLREVKEERKRGEGERWREGWCGGVNKSEVRTSFPNKGEVRTGFPNKSEVRGGIPNKTEVRLPNKGEVRTGFPNKSEVRVVGGSFEVKWRRDGNTPGESTDLKRKKKEDNLDEFVDILDNIVGRRMISDCSVQLDRRFIEVDEEMISTITDIEDDDQAVGFHCALPLHVHGSAYAQMQMVSNHKVDKLNVDCVLVRQNSLDIEQLCSKAAEVICECEGFKFWFCDDYDTEIVEICPLDGSVLIVVFMRLNVEQVNVGVARPVVVDQRHFYECKCLFVWSTERQECWLEAFTHLRPVPQDRDQVDGWSPASKEAERMRRRGETGLFHMQPTPAIRAFVHRLYDEDDNQTDSALEVQDPTNLMLFRLYPVNSNITINSNRIVVL
ncbi:uncharacterized protein LOC111046230 [Nilaparvata lugens]|uniref:uncharacterized protein LOC111046230 n=1 Tax=Nilaparvata lugens TaxID=108931 RepID=UPI00193E64B6|nr:uncharacterized protein LOC111046230 [Nilaparvata lugens]